MATESRVHPELAANGRSLLVVITAACLISLLTFGIRSAFGLFTVPLSSSRGWGRDVFSTAMAIQNLMWGVTGPVMGALADRCGPARVLAASAVLYGAGVGLTAFSTTASALYLTGGFLTGVGMGGASLFAVLGALGRLVPEEQRSWALGVATAAGSLGQFLVAPLTHAATAAFSWETALVLLALALVAVPALAAALQAPPAVRSPGAADLALGRTLAAALGHASYIWLLLGFFACGFQLAFLSVHLPAYLTDSGVSASLAAWAVALIGLFNIVGSYFAGVLGQRRSKKNLLSGLYLGRAVATVAFLLLPVTPATVVGYAALMGLLWLSTVPPTSGLVALMFGTRYLTTLIGIVFLSHQVGSFVGVWIGGVLFERTGSYAVAWWLTVLVSVGSAIVNAPISERPAVAAAAARS